MKTHDLSSWLPPPASLPPGWAVTARARLRPAVPLLAAVSVLLAGALAPERAAGAAAALLAWSDEGLHETDGSDVSVYALFPPYSSFHAQVVVAGRLIPDDTNLVVTYQAVTDARGSINSTSVGKGNFYAWAQALYGTALEPDEGLAGFSMPGRANVPQAMAFDPACRCFSAIGVPIMPYDDAGEPNGFPLLRLVARRSTGELVAQTDLALPVSDQKNCRACHSSGSNPVGRPNAGWVWETDPERDYKLNVLRNHDDHYLLNGVYSDALNQAGYSRDGLYATVTVDHRPVLCLRCHGSNALPGSGLGTIRPLTQVMHNKHAFVPDPLTGTPLSSMGGSSVCLNCHTGPESAYLRGAHSHLAATNGTPAIRCQNCHGQMTDVGRVGRRGWLDEPACQSCHTGTVLKNNGALRYTSVFEPSGAIRRALDSTFAIPTNTPAAGLALYRAAFGHGGMACAACHGSAHGETPSSQPNENVQFQRMQGTPGVLTTCAACHLDNTSSASGGPHGMHPIDQRWTEYHHDWIPEGDTHPECRVCHGLDYRGTALSRSLIDHTLSGRGTHRFWQGFEVGCYNCHVGPTQSSGNTNPPPLASDLSTNTTAARPVSVFLQGVSSRGAPLTFRIIGSPAHGTVSLTGDQATYFPAQEFLGEDAFTYSAWDNENDSNLARVRVRVDSADCLLNVTTRVPTAVVPGRLVPFRAEAALSACAGNVAYDWDFGDGTAHSAETNAVHLYGEPGDYAWALTVLAGGLSQTATGVISISPTLGPPLYLNVVNYDFVYDLAWPWDPIPIALETTTDPSLHPNSWRPILDPAFVDFDSVTTNVWVFRFGGQQFFRLRRVP